MPDDFNQVDLALTRRRVGDVWVSDRQAVDMLLAQLGTCGRGIYRESVDVVVSQRDLLTITGRENLAQAIINRLLTRQGELASLGHLDYGSRLHELIGELNNARTRLRAEMYIRECLAQEALVQEVTQVIFAPPARTYSPDVLDVTIVLRLVGGQEELRLILSVGLGG